MSLQTTLHTTIQNTLIHIERVNENRQLRRLNRRLPLRTIHTAPSGQRSWFDVMSIEWDETSFDERAGVWGVFWCKGVQYFQDARGETQTMTRSVPSYTLSTE